MPRMPADSFERFIALGPTRSYARLAAALGCSKRSVTARAAREGWQVRLAQVEGEAQRKVVERATEDLAAIDERHLKTARAVLARGLEALRSAPLTNGAAAVRAIETAVKMERLVLGADKRPDAGGVTWVEILDAVNRGAEARQARATETPVVAALQPRFVGAN